MSLTSSVTSKKSAVELQTGSAELYVTHIPFLSIISIGDRSDFGPDWLRTTHKNGIYDVEHVSGARYQDFGPVVRFLMQKLIEHELGPQAASQTNGTLPTSQPSDGGPARTVLFNISFAPSFPVLDRQSIHRIADQMIQSIK